MNRFHWYFYTRLLAARLPGALAATSFGTGVYTLALGILEALFRRLRVQLFNR
jgi:hypothetical protein